MKKNIFEAALAIGLAISCIAGAFAMEAQNKISDKLIRLHVIANSDSSADQTLKLSVRDEILKYISSLTNNCKNIDEARQIISENIPELNDIANQTIKCQGFNYAATTKLSHEFFPTKAYDDFSLPAGEYEALQIKLGDASGKNWWCVLFPPVCVSAAEAEQEFKSAGLSDEEIDFVMSDEVEYRFKFKIVEIIENIVAKTRTPS